MGSRSRSGAPWAGAGVAQREQQQEWCGAAWAVGVVQCGVGSRSGVAMCLFLTFAFVSSVQYALICDMIIITLKPRDGCERFPDAWRELWKAGVMDRDTTIARF